LGDNIVILNLLHEVSGISPLDSLLENDDEEDSD
jgi:hypothetical protein